MKLFYRQQLMLMSTGGVCSAAERKQSPLPAAAARISRKTRDRPVRAKGREDGGQMDGSVRMNDGGGGEDVRKTRGVADL